MSVSNYIKGVRESQLVVDAALWESWQQVGGGQSPDQFSDPAQAKSIVLALAADLESRGLLTAWQSKRLLAGKPGGFFIGKYKKLSLLGQGGMGTVYLAEHRLMRRKVAIKVLPERLVKNSDGLQRFHDEARALAALDHRNIVHAYSVDNDKDVHYLVMEYVCGEDLEQRVQRQGPLDFDTAAEFLRQAAEGLDHAHAKGIVHRDVKPSNLLVDAEGTVKLLDLGLAALQTGPSTSQLKEGQQSVVGTADFLAPEQACDPNSKDPRADLYSLGCSLFYLLTGQPPFASQTMMEVILKHQTQPPPDITPFRPDVPPALVSICHRLMAKVPADRYATGAEVAQALSSYLGHEPTHELAHDLTSTDIPQAGLGDFPALQDPSTYGNPWRADAAPGDQPPASRRLLLPLVGAGLASLLLIVGLAFALSGNGAEVEDAPLASNSFSSANTHSFVDPEVKWTGSKQATPQSLPSQPPVVRVIPPPHPPYIFEQAGDEKGLVVIEAEHFTRLTAIDDHSWNRVENAKFSANAAMKSLPDNGLSVMVSFLERAPKLEYDVKFVKSGTHYAWFRAAGPNGTGDSCWVAFDGKMLHPTETVTGFRQQPTWTNKVANKPLQFNVPAPGIYTITVWMREDGLALDRLLFTSLASFKPSNAGPPESSKSAKP